MERDSKLRSKEVLVEVNCFYDQNSSYSASRIVYIIEDFDAHLLFLMLEDLKKIESGETKVRLFLDRSCAFSRLNFMVMLCK